MSGWIPAYTGMTECGNSPAPYNRGGFEIPAYAGMTECGNSPAPYNRGGFEIPAYETV
jgi:hypothetical protein